MDELSKDSLEPRLIEVLDSGDAQLVGMAVWILGELNCAFSIPHLDRLFQRTKDFDLKCAILDALCKIGTSEAIEVMRRMGGRECSMAGN